jgi:aquaporin Z
MRKNIVEFLGTFLLVTVIGLTGDPVAIGLCLIALVYMGGYISGANYNPAVTLGLWFNKKMPTQQALQYMLVQVLGAVLGAVVVLAVTGTAFKPVPGANVDTLAVILIEVIFTFALVFTVLNVATKQDGNQFYGAAIGLILLAGIVAGGMYSGAVYNPAVALGSYVVAMTKGSVDLMTLLTYVLSTLGGGLLAGVTFKYLQEK